MDKNTINKLACYFLKKHGWYQDKDNPFNPEIWCHPCFPFGEELVNNIANENIGAGYLSYLTFVENNYGEIWKYYLVLYKGVDTNIKVKNW